MAASQSLQTPATDAETGQHPLTPLNAKEVQQAVQLLKTLPSFRATTRVISILLHEPRKEALYAWPACNAATTDL